MTTKCRPSAFTLPCPEPISTARTTPRWGAEEQRREFGEVLLEVLQSRRGLLARMREAAWRHHRSALWDETVRQIRQIPNSLSGHLSRDQSPGTLPVRLVTLDALVKAGAIRPPRVIKCDIEGAEYEALVGGEATIRAHKPAIFLATHGPEVHRNCCDLLAAWNYRLESLDDLPVSATAEILAT